MGKELSEGLILDLIEKRRADKFTADELLFAADHPEFIRWVMTHPEEARGLCERKLVTAPRELSPSEIFAADFIPRGYEIVKDVAPTLKSAADLEVVSLLESEDGHSVSGETMRQRAVVKKANLGLADLKVVLTDKRKISVPKSVWFIVFAGTLLRSPGGDLCVACIDGNGGRWVVVFDRLARAWCERDSLARCKSA